jgi:hypothetical protein
MESATFDALARAMAPGKRTRRETLRFLVGTGASLASLRTLADADAKKKRHQKHKHKHTKTPPPGDGGQTPLPPPGDSRCQGRSLLSANGICVDFNDPIQRAAVTCSAFQGCVCVSDTAGVPACIQPGSPLCETTCLSDADCPTGTICVDVAGCCSGAPGIARTCAIPCPPL